MSGEVDPFVVMDRLNSRKVAWWLAYQKIERFETEYQNELLAIIGTILYNSNKAKNTPSIDQYELLQVEPPVLSDKEIISLIKPFQTQDKDAS